jgi:rod shape-determining protein MreC
MKRTNLFVTIFIILIILLISVPNLRFKSREIIVDACAPIAKMFDAIGRTVRAPVLFFSNISKMRQEKEDLANKLIGLEVDKSQLSELQIENALLKKELGFLPETGVAEVIPAKIIQREPTSFLDYVIIDKGADAGVRVDAAVLSSGVFIGKVGEVYEKTARVVLVTSKDSLIQAMLQDSRSKGILRGGISGLFLENIMQDTEFKKGEYVVTSGLGGKIKGGLLIGRADEVQSSDSGIYKSISVESLVDLSKLELIFVEK